MSWILSILGAIFGFIIHNSFSSTLIGVLIGALMGLNLRVNKLSRMQKELYSKVDSLTNQLQQLQIKNIDPLPENEAIEDTITDTPLENNPPTIAPSLDNTTKEYIENTPAILNEPDKILPSQTSHHSLKQKTEVILPSESATLVVQPTASETKHQPTPDQTENHQEGFAYKAYSMARNWLLGGNTILKIGAIILFLGLAFLLRYATEGMTFPIEVRYIGVALSGCVMIGLGWYLRKAEHNYGLVLQGTGVAVLYLTSYAAMYLHQLLAPNVVFIFLLAFTTLAALLALYQNALSLAIAATLGGFTAPILASSGGGNHIALFCYLLLLNIGILSIAWFKAWRPLNIIGFIGTFGMGFAWGIKAYTPAMFWSTEPFLIIFFLLYLAIALLFARRKLYEKEHAPNTRQILLNWSIQQTNYLDATLIFGTPIVAFGLQYTLVQHFTYGAAISALILGIFYLTQAFLFYHYGSKRITLLMETHLALGVIFLTLSIPLAFDAEWTSASWALEAAGVFWISLKQQRKTGQFFSSFLQCAASISYLSQLNRGSHTLLEGSSFGAGLLALSLLFSLYQCLKYPEALRLPKKNILPVFTILGSGFFYLLAPLNLMYQQTAICWVIMGVLTLFISSRIRYSTLFNCGQFIQFLAITLFISQLPYKQLGIGFNTNSHLFIFCLLMGGLLITNAFFIISHKKENGFIQDIRLLQTTLLSGLIILHLSPLFILPWLWVACLWSILGCLMNLLAKRFNSLLLLYFGLALTVVAITTFILNNTLNTTTNSFFNSNFVTLLIISISTLIMAWHTQCTSIPTLSIQRIHTLSRILLITSIIFWSIAFIFEINSFIRDQYQDTVILLITTLSLLATGLLAKHLQWQDLSLTQLVLIPVAFIFLNHNFFHPLSHFGWLVLSLLIVVHFFNLYRLEDLLPRTSLVFCHTIGLWFIVLTLSAGLSQILHMTEIKNHTWNWVVWMIIPSLWLFITLYCKALPWPIKTFNFTYGYVVSLPIAIYLLTWFWLANTYSTGTVASIPYIPLINPLELGLIAALTSSFIWLNRYQQHLPVKLPSYVIKGLLGISLFAMSTAIVFRTAFNWLGVPFHFESQIHSMIVQASLSILWTIIALALMIRGHQKASRELWSIGAALIALVVIKLFFVELGNSGSLARIISFTIVGLLLLIVGYFAPLPPKTVTKDDAVD